MSSSFTITRETGQDLALAWRCALPSARAAAVMASGLGITPKEMADLVHLVNVCEALPEVQIGGVNCRVVYHFNAALRKAWAETPGGMFVNEGGDVLRVVRLCKEMAIYAPVSAVGEAAR